MGFSIQSPTFPLETILLNKFTVDYYQRAYVWDATNLHDLIADLSNEFLNNWKDGDDTAQTAKYNPYYLGEIVISTEGGIKKIIDGQQRITTLTLLLIYLYRTYGAKFPELKEYIHPRIYSNQRGKYSFNMEVESRIECMTSLLRHGDFKLPESGQDEPEDFISVRNIVDRYSEIKDCWNDKINEDNIEHFTYWLLGNVLLTQVETDDGGFAYFIFETMNDRGKSLTSIEKLRGYLLANVSEDRRKKEVENFDGMVKKLYSVHTKADEDFCKMYFRGHLAETFNQQDKTSDFVRIGKDFYRWVRERKGFLGLNSKSEFSDFIRELTFYADKYKLIHTFLEKQNRTNKDYLYLVINNDFGFTLQPAIILSSLREDDTKEIINRKIQIISKHLTKVLVSRIWNQWSIAQSYLEVRAYNLCKKLRRKSLEEVIQILKDDNDANWVPSIDGIHPTLNQQNRNKLKVLLTLITAIISRESKEALSIMEQPSDPKQQLEVEHIWADHYERHRDEFPEEWEFTDTRNTIGDLLVLPKSFNASYGDDVYADKVKQYFEQNILARTLCREKYSNNPEFLRFKERSGLNFKYYLGHLTDADGNQIADANGNGEFTSSAIKERTDLYREILKWDWAN